MSLFWGVRLKRIWMYRQTLGSGLLTILPIGWFLMGSRFWLCPCSSPPSFHHDLLPPYEPQHDNQLAHTNLQTYAGAWEPLGLDWPNENTSAVFVDSHIQPRLWAWVWGSEWLLPRIGSSSYYHCLCSLANGRWCPAFSLITRASICLPGVLSVSSLFSGFVIFFHCYRFPSCRLFG